MLLDLHCHSTRSDGVLDPPELVAQAHAKKLAMFAITDHDCFGSVRFGPATSACIEAAELSCSEWNRTVHILLYRPRSATGDWRELDDVLREQRQLRTERIHAIAHKLRAFDIELDVSGLLAQHDRPLGRPDIARELVAQGFIPNAQVAYDRFIGDGGPCDVPLARFGVGDAVDLARQLGARLSLAHPHTLQGRAKQLFERHDRRWLSAIEAYYGPYSTKERKPWLALAQRYDLVVTGGSDYHGPNLGGGSQLGVDLPADLADALVEWLA